MNTIRSDTVTRPSASMHAAIAAAEVGDDVFGDDPTVNLLEQRMAAMLAKDAAIFVPSVTAEGVETAEQRAFLQNPGCAELQGYLLARPQAEDGLRP
jgi:Threonine aldolase